jgi:hypothetical protein
MATSITLKGISITITGTTYEGFAVLFKGIVYHCNVFTNNALHWYNEVPNSTVQNLAKLIIGDYLNLGVR